MTEVLLLELIQQSWRKKNWYLSTDWIGCSRPKTTTTTKKHRLYSNAESQGEPWHSTIMTILILGSKAYRREYLVFIKWHWEKYNPLSFLLWNQRTRCHPRWFVLICICMLLNPGRVLLISTSSYMTVSEIWPWIIWVADEKVPWTFNQNMTLSRHREERDEKDMRTAPRVCS